MTTAMGNRSVMRAVVATASALALLLWPSSVAAASPQEPDVSMSANVVSGLNQASRVGDENGGNVVNIQLALKLRNRVQLDDLIRRVSTPGSPDYGHYLTPAQFGALFGPTATQVAQAAAFLASNGLQVTSASPGSTLVDATGTIAATQQAFKTRIGHYREASGHEFFANDGPPTLPSGLASIVVGVVGLDNRYQCHHVNVQPRAANGAPPFSPSQIQTAYQLTAAPLTGLSGSGQTLGLLELDDFRQANITTYDTTYSLTAPAPVRQPVDGGAAISNGGEVEVELDIELMHAVTPAAALLVFEGPNTTTGLNDSYSCMVNPQASIASGSCPNKGSGLIASSNSTSWGLCEPQQGQSETLALGQIFAQAASQGQSFFAASGDAGAHDCTPSGGPVAPGLAVDSPASDPNITAAGGTNLQLNPDNTINTEVAWSTHPNSYNGSGGGYSSDWMRPSWQLGPGVDVSANAARQVPDISLDADPNTGYSIFTCGSSSGPCVGSWRSVGGTSAAAPAWAAFAAIYNQYATSQARPNLGFANPTLYGLAGCTQTFTPFNDITVGNNKAGTSTGYMAGPNYDRVTGLGSLRAAGLSSDLATSGPGGLVLETVTPSSGSTQGGNPVTLVGCGFVNQPTVAVGGTTLPAASVQFVSSTTLLVTMPTHVAGTAQITVTNPTGPPSNGLNYVYVPPALVAVVGADQALWQQQDRGGWNTLAGSLLAAPAVVSVPNGTVGTPLYIGVGANHDLLVRTSTQGWRPLDDLPVNCIDNPGAAIGGGTLTVACQGADHHLYMVQGPAPAPGATPLFARGTWQSLGGTLTAGPAVAYVPGRGLDIMTLGAGNNVNEYYSGGYHAPGFRCIGHPALATDPAGATSYFACHGMDGALWWAQTDAAHGGAWFSVGSLGGQLIDGPAIAATNQGPTFYVEGTDHALYERGAVSGYLADGGRIQFGTGAAALF